MRVYAAGGGRTCWPTPAQPPASVRAIGAHGQTVRHRPQEFDGTGYTLQLCQPALLAELTGIDVVADFRSRDVAAGGQGAPLAPFFHQACVRPARRNASACSTSAASPTSPCCAPTATMLGFDCGPGNALMDGWCAQHTGKPYDADGAWAASGQVLPPLLEALLAEPYFAKPPPKSTGRDLFSQAWLQAPPAAPSPTPHRPTCRRRWRNSLRGPAPRTCCATQPDLRRLIVCGGGALNGHLMRRLRRPAAQCPGGFQRGRGPAAAAGRGHGLRLAGAQDGAARKAGAAKHNGRQRRPCAGCIYPA